MQMFIMYLIIIDVIYFQTIDETCVKLEETLNEYTTKMSDFLNNVDSTVIINISIINHYYIF